MHNMNSSEKELRNKNCIAGHFDHYLFKGMPQLVHYSNIV